MIDLNDFNNYLASLIENETLVDEAMNYSLLAGGKRLRPMLLLSLLADLNKDYKEGYKAASALEMVHTYSLIHDDLPAMDNDDYRRGKKTCHKQFNEATAILAGDGLLTKAFEVLANSDYLPEIKVELISLLAKASGHQGMIKGQQLDIEFENNANVSLEMLESMELLKTGELLTVPLKMALAIANRKDLYPLFEHVGKTVGLAFQVQDDILDVTSSPEVMGKSLSDSDNNKTTFVKLLGLENAQKKVNADFKEVYDLICEDYPLTYKLIKTIETRKN